MSLKERQDYRLYFVIISLTFFLSHVFIYICVVRLFTENNFKFSPFKQHLPNDIFLQMNVNNLVC